jgi:hypothetical protein
VTAFLPKPVYAGIAGAPAAECRIDAREYGTSSLAFPEAMPCEAIIAIGHRRARRWRQDDGLIR